MAEQPRPHPTDGYDTILPAQFWSTAAAVQPEIRLMAAVLEEAIALLSRGRAGKHHDEAWYEARLWLESDDTSGTFSFITICDVLGIEPSRVRGAVNRLAEGAQIFVRPRMANGRGRHRVTQRRRRRRAA